MYGYIYLSTCANVCVCVCKRERKKASIDMTCKTTVILIFVSHLNQELERVTQVLNKLSIHTKNTLAMTTRITTAWLLYSGLGCFDNPFLVNNTQ